MTLKFRHAGRQWMVALILAGSAVPLAARTDVAALITDRAAVERVYYNHRLGNKPPFEETLPPETLEQLVRRDLHKEVVLQRVYGIEISQALVDSEVRRINATSRAPDVLAELKGALGNDPSRFARSIARPLVVDRILRERFENDDGLHASERGETERIRNQLLAAKKSGAAADQLKALLQQSASNHVGDVSWRLCPRPGSDAAPETQRRFEDLEPQLQKVLRAQLIKPGDVSAVIETGEAFLLYVAREKTAERLSVTALALPKRSYDQWLLEQP